MKRNIHKQEMEIDTEKETDVTCGSLIIIAMIFALVGSWFIVDFFLTSLGY